MQGGNLRHSISVFTVRPTPRRVTLTSAATLVHGIAIARAWSFTQLRMSLRVFTRRPLPVITDPSESLQRLQSEQHPDCVVCGPANGHGLGLEFRMPEPGVVESAFDCRQSAQGYNGMLHGGVTCMLLDGAMTNCLFAHGYTAVTVELHVRFRQPVQTGTQATVRAWIESVAGILYKVRGEIRQNGRIAATATGQFIDKSFPGLQPVTRT